MSKMQSVFASVHASFSMSALLQVVLEVVQDAKFIKCLGTVCRVFSQGQFFQLQGSAPQQSEAVLKGLDKCMYNITNWVWLSLWLSVKHAYHMTFLASSLLTNLHWYLSEFLCLFIPNCKNARCKPLNVYCKWNPPLTASLAVLVSLNF